MKGQLDETLVTYIRTLGPPTDPVIDEMGELAHRESFPYVGPEVGATLRLLAQLVHAKRVFEFGSGFGYSAYWFASALPTDGQLILTEVDEDELNLARDHLARGEFPIDVEYELGDAMDAIHRYDGPFDVVLIDFQKERYVDAFEAVKSKVRPGGLIIADNVMSAGDLVVFDDLVAYASGKDVTMNEATRGIATYLDTVRADSAFETIILPLGSGIAVSHRMAEHTGK